MQNQFKGVGVALATPFNDSLDVDFDSLKQLIQHVSKAGVHYLVVMGTTGESATLGLDEKQGVLDFVIKNNPNKLPIMYGLGGNNTAALLKELENTNLKGVDGIMSVTPYYNKPNQRGLALHYKSLAEASPVPILLYNVPRRTATNLSAALVLELASHPNIIGIKEASANVNQYLKVMKELPQDFILSSGEDMHSVLLYSMGAVGLVSVLANLLPKTFVHMYELCKKNQFVEAHHELFKLLNINDLMYEEGSPTGLKTGLKFLGIGNGKVRLPLGPASESLEQKIKKELQKLGYL